MESERQAAPKGPPREAPPEVWWLGIDRKWWVLAAVGVGTFMSALNGSVVNTVLSIIMRSYGIDLATTEWIVMVYLVVVSGLLLTFGRLGDMIGHKRVYLLGFAIFVASSVLCGLAPTAAILIVVRAVQAVGSAMVLANSPAILTAAFPARQRGQALGMQGTFTYLGLMVGPALGGYLTNQFGWQAIFFISLPIGLFAIGLAYAAIANVRPPAHGERFDPAGAITFLGGLSALLLVMSHGEDWGWTSALSLGLLTLAIVLLGAFLRVELTVPQPMLDLSLFRVHVFSAATVSALMNYICLYAVTFLVPFYLIQFRGLDPGHAGLLLSSQALIMAISAPLSGTLSDRIGSRLPSTLGMALLTASMVWLATTSATASDLEITARLMLIGLATGIFASPNSSALMGTAPRQRQGVAAAVLAAARNTGMVLGVALAGAVFGASLAAYGGTIGPSPGFLPAFRDAFLVVAVCSAIGAVASLARGPHAATTPARPPHAPPGARSQ